jgi:hypothetical protein
MAHSGASRLVNLPGLSLLRERAAVRAFESQDPSFRDIVFYSEGAGDWPHIGPVIEALLSAHERKISYLSSDPADPGLRVEDAKLRAFQIGTGTMRTILFARMECRHFVMTLPDLDSLWLKRSVHPVHYIYLFHSINSTHTSYRKGAFDAFDTVLCVGPHHLDEIRKTEAAYGLPRKELIEHGSAKLDSVLAEVERLRGEAATEGKPHVLVAPTWGDSSLIERPVGVQLLDALIAAGHSTVLRLHPMTTRRLPQLVANLEARYRDEPLFRLEADMNAVDSWMRSTVMISDWSGAAAEYAFALGKPVIYMDTPPKILNPDWEEIGAPSFEATIRHRIGRVVSEDEITTVPDLVARTAARAETPGPSAAARDELIFNVGASSRVAAAYLASLGRGEWERGGSV